MTNFELDSLVDKVRRLRNENELLRLRNSELELELRALRSSRKESNELPSYPSAR